MPDIDHEKWLKQHDEMMADHEIWMQNMQKSAEESRIRGEQTDRRLDRAIRLAVQDARRQRKWNARSVEEMVELRQLLKVFLERGGNGHA